MCTHTQYNTIHPYKNNTIQSFVILKIQLEIIMLSEIRLAQKEVLHDVTHMWNLKIVNLIKCNIRSGYQHLERPGGERDGGKFYQ
jgi:hypothetical protein